MYLIALILNKPIFTYGKDPNYLFRTTSIDNIEKYYSSENTTFLNEYEKLRYNVLNYIFTKKVNISTLRWVSTYSPYLTRILQSVKRSPKIVDSIPTINTLEGYFSQFFNAVLLNNDENNYYSENSSVTEIYKKLFSNEITAIGFDIFDTLLCRNTTEPTQIFDMMQNEVEKIVDSPAFNFPLTRKTAELYARKNKIEVTFEDVYDSFKRITNLSDSCIERIKNLEIAFEKKFLKPRYFTKNIFDLAKIYGKKVFIASDMYLSQKVIEDLLKSNGYDLTNVSVFISSELNKVKHNGSLFTYILKKENLVPQCTLFIGDNLKSDIEIPSKLGINTFLLPKAFDVLKQTMPFKMQELKITIESNVSLHYALLANKLFDNPYVIFDYSTYINNSSALLGYQILGPLTLSLTIWLIDNIRTDNIDLVLFAARDSKVILNIYNMLNATIYDNKLPSSKYFIISRSATLPLYNRIANRASLISLYVSSLNVKDFLIKIFGINVNNHSIIKKARECGLSFNRLAKDQKVEILKFLENMPIDQTLAKEAEITKEYIKNIINNAKNIAYFDLGTRGTSKDIIEEVANISLHPYFFRKTKYKIINNIKSYIADSHNPYRPGIKKILPSFYECLLSDNLNSTCTGYENINNEIIPKTFKRELDKTSIQTIRIQKYIELFCKDYICSFKEFTKYINQDALDLFILPVAKLASGLTDRKLLETIVFDDPLSTNGKINIIPSKLAEKTSKTIVSNQIKHKIDNQKYGFDDKYLKEELKLKHKKENFKKNRNLFYKNKFTKFLFDTWRKIYLRKKRSFKKIK